MGMNKKYVIQWKSNVNGRAGRGTKMFEKEEAERLAEELNREYPQIHHEVMEVAPAPAEVPEPQPASDPMPLLSVA